MNKETKPKVLIWDLETSFNLAYTFEVGYDRNIPYQNIVTERHLICVSYKWLGDKTIHSISILDDKNRFKKDIHDDYYVASEFRKILEQADAQIYHYGSKFDTPMLNARLAFNKLPPVPKIPTVDTKMVASKYFRFNCNKLDYLAKHLGYKGKMDNPGNLWIKCFEGDVKSIEHMVKYNKQDVDINEYVYNALKPFIQNHPLNRNQFTKEVVCPTCGGSHIQWRGYAQTRVNKYRRFVCTDCGSWSTDRKSIERDIKPSIQ